MQASASASHCDRAGGRRGDRVSEERLERLRVTYAAFNARDVDAVLAQLTNDVDWPNAWAGGRIVGRDAVGAYWMRQWAEIDPTVEPVGYTQRPDGTVAVEVIQTVRSRDGALFDEARVTHVYAFRGDLISRMDVE
jgi:hypothetical protein